MLNFALIGCGRIGGTKHVEAIIENKDILQAVAVCDVVEEKAQRASEKIEQGTGKRPKVYTDYKELLKNEDVDVVAIATESGYHYKISMDALESGKHVLVEKPMALSTVEMRDIIEYSKKVGKTLGVCFQNRFNPAIQELRKKIESGAFGKINYIAATVRWNRNEEYYKQASWRGTWELDGGSLMNQCTHNIDLLQWMAASEVDEIYGVIRNFQHPYIEAEDFGSAIIKFKNGIVAMLEGTTTVYPKNLEETLSIFGEKGTVVIGGLAVNKILVWRFEGEDSHPFMNLPDPDTVYGRGHVPLYRDFAQAIIEGRKPLVDGEEGMKSPEIVLGIYKSALENRPVKLPFDFKSTDMKGWKRNYVVRG